MAYFEKQRIPKVIHYIWFGKNHKNKSVKQCIASWKRNCPDYKIVEWNETNYNIKKNHYMREAYEAKKWAFASDYARYDIIYRYGGVYLDTDVELISNIDKLLQNKMFMCFLENSRVNSGLGFGSVARNPIIKEILQYYDGRSFYKANGEMDLRTCNHNETRVLVKHGLLRNGKEQWLDDAHIYPQEYLNPPYQIPTEKTIAINHFNGSWTSFAHRTRKNKNDFFMKNLGRKNADFIIHTTDKIWDVFDKVEQIAGRKFR
ncbi:MAG: glycosyl transferase [Ruminococcus flavefaciens]|nr:glycosyl transferase [Ruminococcus flavefaciens]